jgi:hypothetical protein
MFDVTVEQECVVTRARSTSPRDASEGGRMQPFGAARHYAMGRTPPRGPLCPAKAKLDQLR